MFASGVLTKEGLRLSQHLCELAAVDRKFGFDLWQDRQPAILRLRMEHDAGRCIDRSGTLKTPIRPKVVELPPSYDNAGHHDGNRALPDASSGSDRA